MYKISDVINQLLKREVMGETQNISTMDDFVQFINRVVQNAKKVNGQEAEKYIFDIEDIERYTRDIYEEYLKIDEEIDLEKRFMKYIKMCVKYHIDQDVRNKEYFLKHIVPRFHMDEKRALELVETLDEVQNNQEFSDSEEIDKMQLEMVYQEIFMKMKEENCYNTSDLDMEFYIQYMQPGITLTKVLEIAKKALLAKIALECFPDYKYTDDWEKYISEQAQRLEIADDQLDFAKEVIFNDWLSYIIPRLPNEELGTKIRDFADSIDWDIGKALDIGLEYHDKYSKAKKQITNMISRNAPLENIYNYAKSKSIPMAWLGLIYLENMPMDQSIIDINTKNEFNQLLCKKLGQIEENNDLQLIINQCARECALDIKTAKLYASEYMEKINNLEKLLKDGLSVEEIMNQHIYTNEELQLVLNSQIKLDLKTSISLWSQNTKDKGSELGQISSYKVIPLVSNHPFKMSKEYIAQIHREYLSKKIARHESKITISEIEANKKLEKSNKWNDQSLSKWERFLLEKEKVKYLKSMHPEMNDLISEMEQEILQRLDSVVLHVNKKIQMNSRFKLVKVSKYRNIEKKYAKIERMKEKLLASDIASKENMEDMYRHLRKFNLYGVEYSNKMEQLQDLITKQTQGDISDNTKEINDLRQELFNIKYQNSKFTLVRQKMSGMVHLVSHKVSNIKNKLDGYKENFTELKKNIEPNNETAASLEPNEYKSTDVDKRAIPSEYYIMVQKMLKNPNFADFMLKTSATYQSAQQDPKAMKQYISLMNQFYASLQANPEDLSNHKGK